MHRRYLHLLAAAAFSILVSSCEGAPKSSTPRPGSTPSPPSLTETSQKPTLSPIPQLVTPAPTQASLVSESTTSPDSKWKATASFEYLQNGYRVRLMVASSDGSVSWSPVDYVGEGEGYTYPFLKYWSPDSRHFLFDEQIAGGSCDFYPIEANWSRLDVKTGQVDDYPLPEGRGHAISPDGSLMAYASSAAPNRIIVRDLVTAAEVYVGIPFASGETRTAQAGDILWNPASSSVLFVAATTDFCSGQRPSFQLFRLDVVSNQLALLVSDSEVLLHPIRWHPAGAILLRDWNMKSWWISDQSGRIVADPSS